MRDEDIYPWRKKVKTLPPAFKNPIVNIIQIGHIPKLVATREKLRETLGMNRKPPTAYALESAQKELQKLVKRTALFEKAIWNLREEPSEPGGD
ncbi:MAG: hypothetical protein ACFE89_04845 [Candidatus Hodarchaeota archaeon]